MSDMSTLAQTHFLKSALTKTIPKGKTWLKRAQCVCLDECVHTRRENMLAEDQHCFTIRFRMFSGTRLGCAVPRVACKPTEIVRDISIRNRMQWSCMSSICTSNHGL